MRGPVQRISAGGVVLALGLTVCAVPAAAGGTAAPPAAPSIATASPATQQLLVSTPRASAGAAAQAGGTDSTAGFFRTRKGAIAVALIAAGMGFTVWTVHDSRKPVKSPVR